MSQLQDALDYACALGRAEGGHDWVGRFDQTWHRHRPAKSTEKAVVPAGMIHLNGDGLRGVKRDAVNLALKMAEGNQVKAARILKIHRQTIKGYLRGVSALGLLLMWAALAGAQTNTNMLPAQAVLAWDASPDLGVSYRLYGQSISATSTNYASFDAGTNLTVGVSNLVGGNWSFVCVAVGAGGIMSVPSNATLFRVPSPPKNLVILQVQYSLTANGPFTSAGNLYVRLEPIKP